jgi:integrase
MMAYKQLPTVRGRCLFEDLVAAGNEALVKSYNTHKPWLNYSLQHVAATYHPRSTPISPFEATPPATNRSLLTWTEPGKARASPDALSPVSLTGLAQAAGIEAHVRPHGLRHATITAALDETNGNVRSVAAFSRHADVRTVSFYDDKRKDGAGEIAATLDLGV